MVHCSITTTQVMSAQRRILALLVRRCLLLTTDRHSLDSMVNLSEGRTMFGGQAQDIGIVGADRNGVVDF